MREPLLAPGFSLAVALIGGLGAVRIAWDFKTNGRRAVFWKDYAWLLGAGIAGAAFGAANDLVTSGLSPEYFELGKGLVRDSRFTLRAGLLGAQAGFAAGIMAAAFLLFANRRPGLKAPAGFPALIRTALGISGWAAAAGIAGYVWPAARSPFEAPPELFPLLSPEKIAAFQAVRLAHTGLYLGLATGTAAAILRASLLERRARRTPSAATPG